MNPSPASAPVVTAEEVMALLRRLCQPLEPECAGLGEAGGRVLRETVTAPEDQPPFDRAAVDGYAVRLEDPGPVFWVVDRIRAGEWRLRRLDQGEAVGIATGGALPCEGLQVVMREDAHTEGASLRILRRGQERNIRFRGENARAGDTVVEAGTRLEHGALGLLAAVGRTRLQVSRRPRVLHVATGNEIVAPEQTPGPGQIRDSNSTLVRAFLAAWGIQPTQRRLPEDEALTLAALCELLPPPGKPNPAEGFDLLLISGGASVGEHDCTRRLFEALGYTVLVSRTNSRPGKPLIIAQRDHALAFGLPGNPLAHFVCLNLHVRVALEAWQGFPASSLFQQGLLEADLEADGHPRETFWPAVARSAGASTGLTPLRWRGSGDLTPLARANALLRVKPGSRAVPRGTAIEFVRTVGSL